MAQQTTLDGPSNAEMSATEEEGSQGADATDGLEEVGGVSDGASQPMPETLGPPLVE